MFDFKPIPNPLDQGNPNSLHLEDLNRKQHYLKTSSFLDNLEFQLEEDV